MTANNNDQNRTREIEIELFKRLDIRLERIEEKMDNMNEKIIRLDAQDVSPKVNDLEKRVRKVEEWQSKLNGQIALIVVPVSAAVGVTIKLIADFLAGK